MRARCQTRPRFTGRAWRKAAFRRYVNETEQLMRKALLDWKIARAAVFGCVVAMHPERK